jgi:hypothetical protein
MHGCRACNYDLCGDCVADWKGSMMNRKDPFPFVTTLHVLNSAILKMARLQPAEKVYRGTKGGILPAEFWTPNESNVRM